MAEYIRQPFAPDQRTMLDLMRLASQDRSRSDLQRAQLRSQGVMNIGQLIASALAGIREDRERQDAGRAAAQRQEQEDAFKRRDQQLREADVLARMADREDTITARREADAAKAREASYKRGGDVAESVGYGPMSEMDMESVLQGPAAGRAQYTFGPGTAEGPELLPNKDQQRAIEAENAIKKMGGTIGPNGQVVMPPKVETPESRLSGEDLLAYLAAQGNEGAKRALAVKRAQQQSGQSVRSPIWVVGADGQFQDLAGVAPPGSKPANTREQGRAVTSGDAGRIADLDTSLDDLGTLASTLQETKDATGVKAQVGASLWQPITDITGWGIDAKKRQGVIDRVKQVIGKALEGGVLRKEDELKYAKILPTISDTPEVAASKLTGLRDALVQRRQTTLDSLADAGYDVTQFNARTPKSAPKASDRVDELIKKYGGGQ